MYELEAPEWTLRTPLYIFVSIFMYRVSDQFFLRASKVLGIAPCRGIRAQLSKLRLQCGGLSWLANILGHIAISYGSPPGSIPEMLGIKGSKK